MVTVFWDFQGMIFIDFMEKGKTETGVYHALLLSRLNTELLKRRFNQWIARKESAPKKSKTVSSAGKVMATVFWDSQGIIFIDYMEKGKTIRNVYYA